jgi:hypothetical protein
MSQKSIRHHYVPQFYQRQFADSEGLVWVYDRVSRTLDKRHPINTAVENKLYSYKDKNGVERHEVEDDLMRQVDGEGSSVISKLKPGYILTRSDRTALSNFAAFQFVRVPQMKRDINEMEEKVIKMMYKARAGTPEKAKKMIEQLEVATGEKQAIDPESLSKFIREERYTINFPNAQFVKFMLGMAVRAMDYFENMNWIIAYAPRRTSFVSSDNPFVISSHPNDDSWGGTGILSRGATKWLPLGPRVALFIGEQGHGCAEVKLSANDVKDINLLIAENSDRIVFGKDEAHIRSVVRNSGIESQKRGSRIIVS